MKLNVHKLESYTYLSFSENFLCDILVGHYTKLKIDNEYETNRLTTYRRR